MTLAAESWIPVLFGGLIPILGAAAIGYVLWRAVREEPEPDDEERDAEGSASRDDGTT